jgi:septum formation protein
MVQADDGLLEWYVDTGEPYGKAGGYAIQGAGAILISTITGSIANVMGLPVAELYELMSKQLKILPISRNSNDEILS